MKETSCLYECDFRYVISDMDFSNLNLEIMGNSVVLGGNSGWFYAPEALTQAAHDRGMYILIAWSLNFLFRVDLDQKNLDMANL